MRYNTSIESIPVSTCMSSKGVITETADQNIYAACRIMHKNNIGSVIILGKNGCSYEKPLGIITERDRPSTDNCRLDVST
ncbi:MAG: CBS domain-containing protein [Candidatus Nitrosopolaris sp.]